MNSQNYYQPLISDTSNEEINYSKSFPIHRNTNKDMELKEPSDTSLDFSNSYNSIYKNKKSNKIKQIICSLRKKKEDQERKEYYKSINMTRFFSPSYNKYSYLYYPFYTHTVNKDSIK